MGRDILSYLFQSFGYIDWFYNAAHQQDNDHTSQGFGSWYLQKNFSQTYLRAGRKNNLDNFASRVQTVINPWLDQFVTLGNQNYLIKNKPSAGTLVLYATSRGEYEFYREDRLIRRIPAQIGRNVIDYSQLPGGYYDLDIRLVNNIGHTIIREKVAISNISDQESQSWFITSGITSNAKNLLQFSRSINTRWFQSSFTLLGDTSRQWAAEANISRPMEISEIEITPTLGMMSGEICTGSYIRLNSGNQILGYFTLSNYQNPNVSAYAPRQRSSYLSYTRNFNSTQLSYSLNRSGRNIQQSIQIRWEWLQPSFNMAFTLGTQKNSTQNSANFFASVTLTFNQNHTRIDSTYSDKQFASSSQYQQEFNDNYGITAVGVNTSIGKNTFNLSSHIQRNATRGNTWLQIGVSDQIVNSSFHYDGMLAANTSGIALGRSNYSGVAILLKTPDLTGTPYSFNVEGSPVIGGETYAIPISRYQDRVFAHTQSQRSDIDMDITLPVNMARGHPGQVFPVKAYVKLGLLYNGFFIDRNNQPISGIIQETDDVIYPNGMFSINSTVILKFITIQNKFGRYICDMSQHHNHYYLCQSE